MSLALAGAQATGAGSDTLVSIENLIGSSYGDNLSGDANNNNLSGGDGDDFLFGGAGKDIILGGTGVDQVRSGDGTDVVTLGAGNDVFVAEVGGGKEALKSGSMSVDIITDFDAAGDDRIDVSGLGSFNFRGTAANKNTGDLTYKTYDSVNGAENALGFDIDGQAGASGVSGPVTVVYGNTTGGGPAEFAIILLNTRSVDASDFITAATPPAGAGSSAAFMASSFNHQDYHHVDTYL